MYIYVIILIIVFLFRRYLSNEYFTSLSYYLKMKYLTTTNTIILKEKLELDAQLKTRELCIDGYCITDKDLGFMSEIPYKDETEIRYKNKDNSIDFKITEEDLYRLNHYWFEGQVVWYYGNIKKIPKGWAVCDGDNGTPDLRDKFVIGSGDNFKLKDEGGKETVTLKESNMPKHSHNFNPYMLDTGNKYYNDTTLPNINNVCPPRFHIDFRGPDAGRCPSKILKSITNPEWGPEMYDKWAGGPCCYASWSEDFDQKAAIKACRGGGGLWVEDYRKIDFWKNPYVCMMPRRDNYKKSTYTCPNNKEFTVGVDTYGAPLGTDGKVKSIVENKPFDASVYNKRVDCSILKTDPVQSVYNESCLSDSKLGISTKCNSFIPTVSENNLQGSIDVDFESVGGGKAHNNMPPYFGLYYIIKLKKKETN